MSGSKFQQTRHWDQSPAATWDCGLILDNNGWRLRCISTIRQWTVHVKAKGKSSYQKSSITQIKKEKTKSDQT